MLKNCALVFIVGMLLSACMYSNNIKNYKKDIFSLDTETEKIVIDIQENCENLNNEFTQAKDFKSVLQKRKIDLKSSSKKGLNFYNEIKSCVSHLKQNISKKEQIKKFVANYYDNKYKELKHKDWLPTYDYEEEEQREKFLNNLNSYYLEHFYNKFPNFLENRKKAEKYLEVLNNNSEEIATYFFKIDYNIFQKKFNFDMFSLMAVMMNTQVTPEIGLLYERPCNSGTPSWLITALNGDSKGTLFTLNTSEPYFSYVPYLNPKIIYVYGKEKYADNTPLKGCIFKCRGIHEYITVYGAKNRVYAFENYDKQFNSVIKDLYFIKLGNRALTHIYE